MKQLSAFEKCENLEKISTKSDGEWAILGPTKEENCNAKEATAQPVSYSAAGEKDMVLSRFWSVVLHSFKGPRASPFGTIHGLSNPIDCFL